MKIDGAIEGIERLIKSIKEKEKKNKKDIEGDRAYISGLDIGLVHLLKVKQDLIEPTLTHEEECILKDKFKDRYIKKSEVIKIISGNFFSLKKVDKTFNDITKDFENKINNHKII